MSTMTSDSIVIDKNDSLEDENDGVIKKVKRKRRAPKVPWRKPLGMPKRPLSAYNLFFQSERERLLQRRGDPNYDSKSGGIGFANLAKNVASKWKTLDAETKAVFQAEAAKEKQRYKKEIELWRASEQKRKNGIQERKFHNFMEQRNPMQYSPPALTLSPNSNFLPPLHAPILSEPSLQRRVTYNGTDGFDRGDWGAPAEPSMKRRVTFNGTDGFDLGNWGGDAQPTLQPSEPSLQRSVTYHSSNNNNRFDVDNFGRDNYGKENFADFGEIDPFIDAPKPTSYPSRRVQSDSFLEMRPSTMKSLSFNPPTLGGNLSLLEDDEEEAVSNRGSNRTLSLLEDDDDDGIASIGRGRSLSLLDDDDEEGDDFKFMNELFTDLNDAEVDFIAGLKHT